ncbi:MAG: AI-2E family transporter [Victivallales bacterium]|nr:AI-2E family transporter [Victivallales bacterium]
MKLLETLRNGSLLGDQVRNAFDALQRLLLSRADIDAVSQALVTLAGAVLRADGKAVDPTAAEAFRKLLPEAVSGRQADVLVEELKTRSDWEITAAVAAFADWPEVEKISLLDSLVKLACADGHCRAGQARVLEEIGRAFQISSDDVTVMRNRALTGFEHQQRVMRSWTGIIVAVVIMVMFILTATFLKAVLFGFVLAYIFMPLALYFYRRFSRPGPLLRLLSCWKIPLAPLYRYSARIRRSPPVSPAAAADTQMRGNVNKAIGATALIMVVLGLAAVMLITSFSAYYVAGLGSDIKQWADRQVMAEKLRTHQETGHNDDEAGYIHSFTAATIRQLEEWRKKIEQWPVIQTAMEKIADSLRDQSNQKALASAILKRTSGFFSVTAGFFSTLVSLLFVALMTTFFFLLFLQKMVLYTVRSGRREGLGQYVVKSLFSTKWMPYTSPDTKEQAQRILDDIGTMLRTWLKGYLTIIIIESTVYTTLFTLLGVPYAMVLGVIAGSTVLLPYIGPISSASLTLLVTMAVGAHPSVVTLGAIILVYIVVCGICDQFILYPALVGEALGLNTIETIIVVLLGGMFAGLPGMIFAVPTASVIKYLIPQIYLCWQTAPEAPGS